MTKQVLVIENFTGTTLGQVGRALDAAGAGVEVRQVWTGAPVPEDAAGFDALVVLGGEQSALDDDDHPYLPRIAALTRAFGAADKPVLGICLGAQLVARGYGAINILGRPIEFGWQDVQPTAAGRVDPVLSAIGEGAPLFHWHLDTFTLPPGAVHLARSAMTEMQAFRIGRAVYGIQFHFEADRPLVRHWNAAFAPVIAEYAPDWPERHAHEAVRCGPRADAAGKALADAWVALI